MARLETQINQIYLTHPEANNVSLVLYEEAVNSSAHVFIVAELANLQKKTEAGSLKKITEIILASFRANKRLAAEALFEASLAQINQNLADLAHAGNKSWVGKFSCLIALKSGENIYVANNGQTCAWLKRKSELIEILGAEKRGIHPLKSFQNFSQGRIASDDAMILTTANIFNYVSFELFTKTLERFDVANACLEISKILQQSIEPDQGFCSFFLAFSKKPSAAPVPEPAPEPAAPAYAPQPEEIEYAPAVATPFWQRFPKLKLPQFNFKLPGLPEMKFKWPKFSFNFFTKLSLAGKFFFLSFAVFFILFAINLSLYGFKLRSQRQAEKITAQVERLNSDLSAIQSALIYKDDQQALKLYDAAQADFQTLKTMDPTKTGPFVAKLAQAYNQVNKTSVAENPKTYAQFTRHPLQLAKSPTGFLLSTVDSNSLSQFDGKTDTQYFLLNSLKQNITSIAYWAPVGPAIAVSDQIYRIDTTLKQYESFVTFSGAQIDRIKTYNNNLYALDTKNGKLYRIVSSKGKITTQVAATGDFSGVRDFAIDKDIYLLFANHITKISGSTAQAFTFPYMTDAITNATRIYIGNNLYLLEPNKKRVVIMSKTGLLINQISFPTTNTPLDLFVDEAARSLYLLDDNVMYRITF